MGWFGLIRQEYECILVIYADLWFHFPQIHVFSIWPKTASFFTLQDSEPVSVPRQPIQG